MNLLEKIIAIDVGNSFIKVKHHNSEEIRFIHSDEFTIDVLKKYIDVTDNNYSVVISSVDADMESRLVNFFAENNTVVYLADTLLRKQNIIDFSNVKGMGNDRKVGLMGAIKFFDTPIITIDCGTAITINLLSKDNICLGGAIMCGVGTQTSALEYYTSSLPKVKIKLRSFNDIDNTEAAINSGVFSMVRGGVMDFVTNMINKKKLDKVNIVFAGGYGLFVHKLCEKKFNKISVTSKINSVELKNNIVLYGLEKLLEIN